MSDSTEAATLKAWMRYCAGVKKLSDEERELIKDYIDCDDPLKVTAFLREQLDLQRALQREQQDRKDRLRLAERELQLKFAKGETITPMKAGSNNSALSAGPDMDQLKAFCDQLKFSGVKVYTGYADTDTILSTESIQELYGLAVAGDQYVTTIQSFANVMAGYNNRVTEDAFQKSTALSVFLHSEEHSAMNMVDTHSKACIFSEPRLSTGNEEFEVEEEEEDGISADIITTTTLSVVYLSNKPDLISKLFPLIMELKSHKDRYKLILQCLKRVYAISENHGGLYHGAVCFAVTDDTRYCYLITYQETLEINACFSIERKKVVRIHKINHNDVGLLWLMFSDTPKFFLAQDGGAIVTVLKYLDLNPYCCRITLLSASSSRVYKIVVPKTQIKLRVNINRQEYCFALKINDGDMSRHEREAVTSMAVGKKHFEEKVPFHVHRVLTVVNGSVCEDNFIKNCSKSELFSRLNNQRDALLLLLRTEQQQHATMETTELDDGDAEDEDEVQKGEDCGHVGVKKRVGDANATATLSRSHSAKRIRLSPYSLGSRAEAHSIHLASRDNGLAAVAASDPNPNPSPLSLPSSASAFHRHTTNNHGSFVHNYLVNPCADELKWRYSAPHSEFGAVIMELGEPLVQEDLSSASLYAGVTRSLNLMHLADYAHCDIRSHNMMKFPQFIGFEYRVIDFDLAVSLSSPHFTVPNKYSAQYQGFPVVAKEACSKGNKTVMWHTDYDIAMFYEYILRKLENKTT